MPYIKNEATKDSIDKLMEEVVSAINNPGDLNFAITSLINHFWKDTTSDSYLSYVAINDIIGALECAKAEFYRRVAVPYEEQKMAENGDVYK